MNKINEPHQVMSFEDMLRILEPETILRNDSISTICNGFNEAFAWNIGCSFEDSKKYLDKTLFEKKLKEYEEAINSKRPFAEYGINPHNEIKKYESLQKFKNQIVFDLGAGEFPGSVYKLLSKVKAKGYIGVEALNFEVAKENLEEDVNYYKQEKYFDYELPLHIIDSDMKTVLKKIPDNSASFITSGIDWAIITDDNYFNECMSLIAQKLHPKGIHIDNCSDFHYRARSNPQVNTVKLDTQLYAITKK
ncbi:hypothetical protein K9M74_00325 [Candidatus Woesearchaeota archaeon]|nr:hypothetical protein [Candidatus Woesearchaeota archaeon]